MFACMEFFWIKRTIDCIKREFREETNLKVKVVRHFYTTDFFQKSAFNPQTQILSVYYLVVANQIKNIKVVLPPKSGEAEIISFRWIPLKKISPKDFTFPIDKKV